MTTINNKLSCCGLAELEDIIDNKDNPKETITQVCQNIYNNDHKSAFIIFSDIEKKIAGKNLEKYIKKNNLGKIIKTSSSINPNSGNSLKIWTWIINKKNLYNFWKKIKKEQNN